jgi:SNF2 family DNA or RNA helicase
LTEANHIILLDQWWNNSIIQQAKARVHRIGQTKKVYMYELFIPNTKHLKSIEEAMLEICINKSVEAEEFLKGNKDFNDEKNKKDHKLDATTMQELLNSVKGYRKGEKQN